MNPWQTLRQLRSLIQAATWPDAPHDPVFASRSVVITADDPDALLDENIEPSCGLAPLDGEADEQEPRILRHRFRVALLASVAGSRVGSTAVAGGNRGAGGLGGSAGRGVLELEEPVLQAVGRLNQTSGVRMQVKTKSAVEAVFLPARGVCAQLTLVLEGIVFRDRFYHPPVRMAAVALGGGQVSLTWALPPARYDLRQMVLRRMAGATPPADQNSGTNIALANGGLAPLPTGVVDTPGAGTWSYALFAGYNETAGYDGSMATATGNERYSLQNPRAADTVVAT